MFCGYAFLPMTRNLFRTTLYVCICVACIGCGARRQVPVVSVPNDLEQAVASVFDSSAEMEPSVRIIVRSADERLDKAFENADVFIGWWQARLSNVAESARTELGFGDYGGEAVYPAAVKDVLVANDTEGSPIYRALPICIDPWIMIWREDYLSAYGGRSEGIPYSWEEIKPDGPVFALPGAAADARLAWAAVLEESYTEPDKQYRFSGGLRKLASFQLDGFFQRGAFSYPWSDAEALLIGGEAAALYVPVSRFRKLDPKYQSKLVLSRPPAAAGSGTYSVCADILVAVITGRRGSGERASGILQVISDPAGEREIADAIGAITARLDARLRDGFDQTAKQVVRNTARIFLPPVSQLETDELKRYAELSDVILRSPSEADMILQ